MTVVLAERLIKVHLLLVSIPKDFLNKRESGSRVQGDQRSLSLLALL